MTSKKDKYTMLEDSFEQKYDELQDLLKDADDIYGTTIKNTKYRTYYLSVRVLVCHDCSKGVRPVRCRISFKRQQRLGS